MSQEEEEKLEFIVDKREEKMVSHTGGIPTIRLARFLKPSVTSMDQVTEIPPLVKTKTFNFEKCPFQVNFKSWRRLQRYWIQWVDQLKPKYEALWKKTGIYDSIMGSTYEISKNNELILGLAECWCPDTNTFMFKWGEATMTLEDMLVIGGFSILGKPVTAPLTTELLEIEEKLIQAYKEVSRTKSHKTDHAGWLNHFMGSDDDLGHVAFLSLWLSRYVFPTPANRPDETMSKQIFPVAIHLSQATRIALAPAILASLYRDLRTLKEEFASTTEDHHITVCAPFHIMQQWAWERFPNLQPTPKPLNSGEPRAARWHKLKSNLELDSVRSTINSPDDFQFRPYSFALENWRRPSYYKERGKWVIISPNSREELLSFSRCLVPCELVGFDCIEQYTPHRVGMQFGMDQDIPLPFTRANANWESAWRTYDKSNFCVYIPPRLFESDVTARYLDWWNQSISSTHAETTSLSAHKRSSSSCNIASKSENSKSSGSPPGISCKHLCEPQTSDDEDDTMSILSSHKRQQDLVVVNHKAANIDKSFSSAQVQSSASTTKEETNRENPMTDTTCSNLYEKPPKRIKLFEEDKDVRSEVLADAPSDACNHEELIDILQIPGLELEAQIDDLEMVVQKLKEKFILRKVRRRSGGESTSHG
ncbi:Aminotransferase-like, plant mobile domain family protein [Thalictrum thalictroides]|uniref:Aminotransferase-like, plant mobile domain family protein n=1 Tax=Thalictrum thalictroides TaxID=46969 RepID=A0A7J6V2G1_THATH|nr:Aminotransferase-like, plant mobile domain family protein [Thalictrum thalictroides]